MRKLLFLLVFISTLSCKKDLKDLSETIYVRNDGADMPAYVHGNAEDKTFVIILHGGPGGSGLEYRTGIFQSILEKKYAMVYWDQRGQGMSEGTYDESYLNVAQLVEDLEKLVLVLKEEYGNEIKLFLLGHSWGGALGSAYLIQDDNQFNFKGWIEMDGAHNLPLLNKEAIKMFLDIGQMQIDTGNSISFWSDIRAQVMSFDTSNIKTEDATYLNTKGFEAEDRLIEDDVMLYDDQYTEGLIANNLIRGNVLTKFISGNVTNNGLFEEVEQLNSSPKLNVITIPCLFQWGKYDFVVPPALGEEAFSLVSSAEKELVIYEFSGHSPMNNEPDLVANDLIEFIDKHK
ncbi:MAG: alpha/beta hydrolase [Flavobacteriales bacterium]|nr:alpha/beta hydrolase [Flavobacteriales bacterium]